MVTNALHLAALDNGALQANVVHDAAGLWLLASLADEAILTMKVRIIVDGSDLSNDSVFLRSTSREVVEELAPKSGKRTIPSARRHHELTAPFRASQGLEWALIVRLSDDGVSLRYAIPDLQGVSELNGERTSLVTEAFDRAWVLDYQTWYETPRYGRNLSELATGEYGFPLLFRANSGPDRYVLVTESAIDGPSGTPGPSRGARRVSTSSSSPPAGSPTTAGHHRISTPVRSKSSCRHRPQTTFRQLSWA